MKRTKAIDFSIVKFEYVFENLTNRFTFKRSSKNSRKWGKWAKRIGRERNQENKVIKLNRISRLSFISNWNLSSFFPSINFTVSSSVGEGNDNPL